MVAVKKSTQKKQFPALSIGQLNVIDMLIMGCKDSGGSKAVGIHTEGN